jgi:glycosyltransferase involved in cell wall biosynthesis
MAKVSVVIPCYNLGEYIDEAIDSVLAQTLSDYEIVIVNDGSDDSVTDQKLKTLVRPRTRVINTTNQGVAAARNRGIVEATGEYILPLDADDTIAPTYLEKAVAVLETRPTVGIVYCKARLFGEVHGDWQLPEFSLPHLLLDNLIFSAALFRRADWQEAGGYNQAMRTGWEDWDFWLRIVGLGKEVFCLAEPLFSYRIRRGSRDRTLALTDKCRLMARMIANNRRLYLRHTCEVLQILLSGTRRRPPAVTVRCDR